MAECAAFSAGYEAGERDGRGAGNLPQAAQDVLAERRRQVEAEGWTPEHDDEHDDGELAAAGATYALSAANCIVEQPFHRTWPWQNTWWKPTVPRRDLVKAGALILAEIERLDRAARDVSEPRAIEGGGE